MAKTLLRMFFGMLVILIVLSPQSARAQGAMGRSAPQISEEKNLESADEVLAEILSEQGVETREKIDCAKVTDTQFERLGEAWMSLVHPDPEIHERMDEMMGGEGSRTLRTAHINMGKNYLGCQKGIEGRWMPMMGMMGWGGGMMNPNWTGTLGGWGSLHVLFGLVTWILVMALLVVLIRYFWKRADPRK